MGLIANAVGGDRRALARLATVLERGGDAADRVHASLPTGGIATQTIGITGPPGAGKSSIINLLIDTFLGRGDDVAVMLVDPSSPFTGGAVLGDRVRMNEWPDDRVFIRSLASRGWGGGLAPSTAFMIRLFAAAGFGRVIVESVGVGQDAVDIRELADTVMVVQVPNLGDTVQTLKAGILEIGDLYVVNKADLPGAQTTVRELNAMLGLIEQDPNRFDVPVLAISAAETMGIAGLVAALDRHRSWLETHRSPASSGDRQTSWFLEKRLQAEIRALSTRDDYRAVRDDLSAGRIVAREALARVTRLLAER